MFECTRCGKCCHEYQLENDEGVKSIHVFIDELEKLETFALKNQVDIKFLEGVIFPDTMNNKILVITYRVILDAPGECCPFFDEITGCRVNSIKPLVCRAYPIARKRSDAYHDTFYIDPYCQFVEMEEEYLKQVDEEGIKSIFPCEYEKSKELMEKNQALMLCLNQLKAQGLIEIPEQVSTKEFNRYLLEWDREFLTDFC